MKRSWSNAAFAQSPLGRTRDIAALRRLGTDLSNVFEGMTLNMDAKQELVSDWAIPVTFPATCHDPNRFVVPLARRGVRLETCLSPPYTGYRYVLRVPKTRPAGWVLSFFSCWKILFIGFVFRGGAKQKPL